MSSPPSSPAQPPRPEVLQPTIKVDHHGGGSLQAKLDTIDVDPDGGQPPALPPRPPPRPRACHEHRDVTCLARDAHAGLADTMAERVLRRSCWLRKYVFLCTASGGLSILLGALFLTVYFMLRSYTSSLNYFETIPTYIPAAMLIGTGMMVMSLSGRRNRYSYLIKMCGICCLCCAVLCVVITVTTTVFHMNRLQSLRECVFTQKTQTCTCYSVLLDSTADRGDDGVRYVFNSTPDCEVIHGALYSCLRAMFGLSVIGILVCIFSCMLVYQLLSHEKKKMYWEQLELRCRYLSRQQRTQHCSCCEECHYPVPLNQEMFPWELDDRYWSPRVGNLYSPNPGGHEVALTTRRSGWSWRRLPWTRSASVPPEPTTGCISTAHSLRHAAASPDSQYGFSSRNQTSSPPSSVNPTSSQSVQTQPFTTENSHSFYMWGPPPPYSSPCRQQPLLNLLRQRSPAHGCHQGRQCHPAPQEAPHEPHRSPERDERCAKARKKFPARVEHLTVVKPCDNYVNTSEGEPREGSPRAEGGEGTLVIRRAKKFIPEARVPPREEAEGYEGLQACHVGHDCCQERFSGPVGSHHKPTGHDCCQERFSGPVGSHHKPIGHEDTVPVSPRIRYLAQLAGIANRGFDTQENRNEPSESEVYFADVSSCCNVSVKNDGQDGFIYDEAGDPTAQATFSVNLQPIDDLEAENLLQSNCFSYQRFSKSRPWEGETSEMECSSNEATPVTEDTDSTFVSPLTPEVPFYEVDEEPYEQIPYLAPDAQYETIPPQKPVPRQREDVNEVIKGEKPTPTRRRLNLTGASPSVREILHTFENFSTEDESERQQSDVTLDSGCHSDEFASRRGRASTRNKEGEADIDEDVVRSVNV